LPHQIRMSMSEVEQVNLARIVLGSANGKTEFRAKRRALIIDLACQGLLGFCENCPPEGRGDGATQERYDGHDRRNPPPGSTWSAHNWPSFHFASPCTWLRQVHGH
jgi:hypothetical protein